MTDLTVGCGSREAEALLEGNCVEVADNVAGVVAVRDSKKVDGPALLFDASQWRSFVNGVKAGAPS